MDYTKFNLKDLLEAAVKSEIDSYQLYSIMAKKTKNGLLQDKLNFLAKEEEKHQKFIEDIFKNQFPDKKLDLPDETLVPLPEIKINEETPMSKMLKQAMAAEKNASDFYKNLAERFEKDSDTHKTLLYFADMEVGHYKILELEKQSMERFEDADQYWPMVHAGP